MIKEAAIMHDHNKSARGNRRAGGLGLAAAAVLALVAAGSGPRPAPAGPQIVITVLYDNYAGDPACVTDWGFSCLVRGLPKVLLFDVGAKPEVFRQNTDALGVNLSAVEILVISHFHGDHTGGLEALLEKRPRLTAYLPDDPNISPIKAALEKAEARTVTVREPLEILPGVWSTGTMEKAAREQSLIIDTPQGATLLTGCAHQGILEALDRARSLRPAGIRRVLGGFHLLDHPAASIASIVQAFRKAGVSSVGASHCTGDAAIEAFKREYGPDFIVLGVGRKI
jgi:7,8-dihydropterin-6-yl-methyl-4-(beta-D-ribofuranosyl)aminobenzene 5'-phosphate synthase